MTAINRRADLLRYVFGLLATVPGVQTFNAAPCVFRNRGELPPNEMTPGFIMLDGPVQRKTPLDGMNFTAMPAAVFTVLPEIVLAMTPRDDVGNTTLNGVLSPVDVEIEAFETALLNIILNDETLVAMVGDDGSIAYDGFETDMRNGSSIGATGAVTIFKFAFSYVLDPSELI